MLNTERPVYLKSAVEIFKETAQPLLESNFKGTFFDFMQTINQSATKLIERESKRSGEDKTKWEQIKENYHSIYGDLGPEENLEMREKRYQEQEGQEGKQQGGRNQQQSSQQSRGSQQESGQQNQQRERSRV